MPDRSKQLRRATVATLAGWVAGILATLPFQFAEVARNTGGDSRLMISVLGYGLAIWFAFTLMGVVIAWVVVVLPTAFLLSTTFLLRRPAVVVVVSTLLGILVVAREFRIWEIFGHPILDLSNFWLYLTFASVFAAVTSWSYLRQLARAAAA